MLVCVVNAWSSNHAHYVDYTCTINEHSQRLSCLDSVCDFVCVRVYARVCAPCTVPHLYKYNFRFNYSVASHYCLWVLYMSRLYIMKKLDTVLGGVFMIS